MADVEHAFFRLSFTHMNEKNYIYNSRSFLFFWSSRSVKKFMSLEYIMRDRRCGLLKFLYIAVVSNWYLFCSPYGIMLTSAITCKIQAEVLTPPTVTRERSRSKISPCGCAYVPLFAGRTRPARQVIHDNYKVRSSTKFTRCVVVAN